MTKIAFSLVFCFLLSSLQAGGATKHLFGVKDSIEMDRFSPLTQTDEHSLIEFSPNGDYFVFVTSRGVIASDQIESRLWIYNARQIEQRLQNSSVSISPPRLLVSKSAIPLQKPAYFPYSSIITNVKWASDSQVVYFTAQLANGNRTLCRVGLRDGDVSTLTSKDEDVTQYAINTQGVVYLAVNQQKQRRYIDSLRDPINADAQSVNGLPFTKLLFPYDGFDPQINEVWIRTQGKNRHVSKPSDEMPQQLVTDPLDAALSLSPDGNMIVRIQPVKYIPNTWSTYQPAPHDDDLRIKPGNQQQDNSLGATPLDQFVLTNSITGRSEVIVKAPVARALGYFSKVESKWSENGQYLLLTNTFLPLENQNPDDLRKITYPCLAAVAKISSKQIDCLQFYNAPLGASTTPIIQLHEAHFVGNTVSLTLEDSSRSSSVQHYDFLNGHWKPIPTSKDSSEPVTSSCKMEEPCASNSHMLVKIHQSLNDPPVLQVADERSGRMVHEWNPNPQFASVTWGEASVISWKDQNGNQWKGGLIRPVGYTPGKRYPLVIQMYSFTDGEFMTDGMAPTGMAARAIASAGMFYLQANKLPGHTWDQKEAQDHLDGTLSAIDTFSAQGLIDPTKVGIIGFSFTGWYVENELVKAPERFAAATIADGADNSYTQYLFWAVLSPGLRKQAERINGGAPFGDGLQRWIANAPAFHLDQVTTPLRVEAITPGSLIGDWELYTSLYQQGKPVDLIYYPTGQHQLQKPLERLASEQGNVDWFRFWLQGYERSDSEDSNQYKRWRRYRALRDTNNKTVDETDKLEPK